MTDGDATVRRLLRTNDVAGLCAHFEGFARWIVADLAYFLPGGSADDLMQEARIGMLKAVHDYRGDGGASFRNFAALCIRRQVITAVKTATREKHGPLNHAIGLDQPVADTDDGTLADVIPLHGSDPVEKVIAREDADTTLATIAGGLTDLEREAVLSVLVGDLPYGVVARSLGVTKKTIDNALQRARGKLADPENRARSVQRARALRPRNITVYVRRRERFTPDGARTRRQAIDAVLSLLGPDAELVACAKRALAPDGGERRDTRGHPRADGKRPIAVWRVTVLARPERAAA